MPKIRKIADYVNDVRRDIPRVLAQRPKVPLVLAIFFQVASLLLFLSLRIEAFIGESDVGPIAQLYESTTQTWIVVIALGLLTLLLISIRAVGRTRRLVAAGVVVAALVTGWGFLVLAIYPLLLIPPAEDGNDAKTEPLLWESWVWGVIAGAWYLMTQQVPFPHAKWTEQAYVSSLSFVYLGAMAVGILATASVLQLAVRKLPVSRRSKYLIYNAGPSAVVFLVLLWSVGSIFANVAEQFDLPTLPWLLAGLLASLLLVLVGESWPNSISTCVNSIVRSLAERWFWWKLLVAILFIRYSVDWLVHSRRRDFLYEFLVDAAGLTFPALTLFLGVALATRVIPKIGYRWVQRTVAAFLIAGTLGYLVVRVNDPVTLFVDKSGPLVRFISSNVRKVLNTVGVEKTRGSIGQHASEIDRRFRKYSASRLTIRDVFPDLLDAENQKRLTPRLGFKPYIFVYVSDATTASHLSVYGYKRDTSPYLRQFARESVLFENYLTAGTSTQIGMRSMFTGTYVSRQHARGLIEGSNLCRSLMDAGYLVLFDPVATTLGLTHPESGCDSLTLLRNHTVNDQDWKVIADHVKSRPQQPVFYYVYSRGGHSPWRVEADQQVFGSDPVAKYDAQLRNSDSEFQDMVNRIKRLGILDQSVIIFTSDHGIGLGNHNDTGSYSNLYADNIHIPLMVRIPSGVSRRVSNQYAQPDFRFAVEELIGAPLPAERMGLTFLPELFGSVPPRKRCTFGTSLHRPRYMAQCTDGIKVIYYANERFVEVFDEAADRNEVNNLAARRGPGEFPETIDALARFMALALSQQ